MAEYWAAFSVLYNDSLFINMFIPQNTSTLLVNCLQYTLPVWSLGLWGFGKLSGDETSSPMRKPQGQRSLCALPPQPSASVLSGNRPLQIPQEGVQPLVANVGSRTSPGGSQGNCPPAQRPCSAPQLRSSCSQHHPQSSLQTRKTHPPSGLGFMCLFFLGYFTYQSKT